MPKKWKATYEGPSARADSSTVLYVDGVRLNKDVPTEVDDDLAKELREGSDRLKGQKFKVEEVDETEEKKSSEKTSPDETTVSAQGRKVG